MSATACIGHRLPACARVLAPEIGDSRGALKTLRHSGRNNEKSRLLLIYSYTKATNPSFGQCVRIEIHRQFILDHGFGSGRLA